MICACTKYYVLEIDIRSIYCNKTLVSYHKFLLFPNIRRTCKSIYIFVQNEVLMDNYWVSNNSKHGGLTAS